MTVIAALRHNDTLWMAADKQTVDGCGRIWPIPTKLMRIPLGNGLTAVAAFAGHRGINSLLRRQLTDSGNPLRERKHLDDWAQHVADQLATGAREPGPNLLDADGHLNAFVLLAYGQHCYAITDGAADPIEDIVAAGAGGDLALGALIALQPQLAAGDIDPESALRLAVDIAGRYDDKCGREATVMQVGR